MTAGGGSRQLVLTGATGSLGTAMLSTAPAGWAVTGLARRLPDTSAEPYARAAWVARDLAAAEPTALAELLGGVDAVVHAAWPIQPRADDREKSAAALGGSRHLLAAAAKAGVGHVVVLSSVAAYSPPPRHLAVDESWPCGGVKGSVYSRDKATLESMLDAFEELHPGVRVARIRPCGIVQAASGPQIGRWTLPRFLPRRVVGSRLLPIPIWRGLRAQVVHAADVARLVWAVLDAGAAGAFNAAAEPPLDGRALARALGGVAVPVPLPVLTALAWPTWRLGLQPAHPGWLRLADRAALVRTDRARRELGWSPQWGPEEALAAFVRGLAADAGAPSPPLAPGREAPGDPGRPSHQPG